MRTHDFNEWFNGDLYSPNVDGTGPRNHKWDPVNLKKFKKFHNLIMDKDTPEPRNICAICSWQKEHPFHARG